MKHELKTSRVVMFFSGYYVLLQDTLRDDCDSSDDCVHNCCVSRIIAPVFFVVFVLMAQFVLVNVVVAVLMKHLEVRNAWYPSYMKSFSCLQTKP